MDEYCSKCFVVMEKQEYKRPYVTRGGKVVLGSIIDVYICPCCGREKEIMENEEDGYSAGAGLFCDE